MTSATTPPRRTRRGWIVALVVTAVVLIAAVIAGEFIARALVPKIIADKVRTGLDLPADQQIDVRVTAPSVLLETIIGSYGQVDIATTDLTIGDATISQVRATGIDVGLNGTLSSASIDAVFTPDEVLALIPQDVVQIDELTFADDAATAHTSVAVLGSAIDISLTMTPKVADGGLELTPVSAKIGSLEVTAEGLSSALGGVAGDLVKPIPVCLASSIPVGVDLTTVAITGDTLRASANLDGYILTDPALQQVGTCP